jgi:serine/threonine protein kinase
LRRLGHYTLLERLASGPSSDIHLAWNQDRGLLAAAKVVKPRIARDRVFAMQLLKEAESAIRFRHRSAAALHDVERIEPDQLIVATDLVEGQPLSHVLQRAGQEQRPLSRDMLLWIAAETASVLSATHQIPWCSDTDEPMVHGALTPYSIMIAYDGRVQLLGVGIGRSRFQLPPSPVRLAYRAPEIFGTNTIEPAGDIYALGLIIYESLTNRRLFRRATPEETRKAILAGELPRLKSSIEYVNELLDELIAQMLARTPDRRPKSAGQVEQALRSQFRGSNEIMVGRLAEHMQRCWQDEYNAERQLIDVARRKVLPGARPSSNPSAPAFLESDPAPLAASDLLADISQAAGQEPKERPRELEARTKAPISSGDRKLLPQSGPQSPIKPPPLPRERKSSSGSGAAPIAGPPPRTHSSQGKIGRFEVIADLGRVGGTNAYEALAADTRQAAYVKVLDPSKLDDQRLRPEEWIRCFEREGQVAAALKAPGLPELIEAGLQGNLRFLAYDRVQGLPLNTVIARGKSMPASAVRRAMASAAKALFALHRAGYVYCNVQAQHVLLLRDHSVRLDDLSFVAPATGPMHPLLMTNLFALAPEYLNGREYSPASDQFALGALLYELLTGTRPFRGLDDRAMMQAICEKDPIPPMTIDSAVDPALSEAAMRALAKAPSDRFESAQAMAEVLMGADQLA